MHTQGEWKAEKYTVSGIVESYLVRMPNGYTVSTSSLDPDKKDNAYLIAAAPDLLAALERFNPLTERTPEDYAIRKAALAKAKAAQ